MSYPSPSRRSGRLSENLGLRTVLVVPFVLQVVLAVGLTGYLSLRNGQQAVNDVARQLRAEVTTRVDNNLRHYLDIPHRVNQLNSDALSLGGLDLEDAANREMYFWRQLKSIPEISNSYIGLGNGDFFGAREVLKDGGGAGYQTTLRHADTGGELHYYDTNPLGRRAELSQTVADYDPRRRPWYKSAEAARRSAWSEIYADAGTSGLTITAVRPLYRDGQLWGVLGAALRLTWIDQFLSGLQIGSHGQVFIMQQSGLLVATSRGDATHAGGDGKAQRLLAQDSTNPTVRRAAEYLHQKFGASQFSAALTPPQRPQQLDFNLEGERQFLQVTPLQDQYGLDWLIVVVVPEADFMERIRQNTSTTLVLCALALLIALGVGIATARWIIAPLQRLNTAARNLASGDWNYPLRVQRRDELGQLAASFSSMARQLQEVFTTLEEKVRERTLDLANKNEELQGLNQQLVKLNQDKNEFLGIAAHDLKNPLSAIKGLAEEIQEAYDDMGREEVIEYASKIHLASQKMFALITNLLDVNAIESGKMNVSLRAVDIFPLVQRLAEHYAGQAQAKRIELAFAPDAGSHVAQVDDNTTHQVLDNLISNAVKYSPAGKSITVRLHHHGKRIRVEVEDQGPGLSDQDKQKLFGKFNRLSAKPTGGEHSTGLGLFIVKKLVEAMHGEVWCESELGRGACFIVEFPAA